MVVNIAIDGPAGAGKSTIAREVAERLGYIYVDTGALYRTVGLAAKNNSIDTGDRKKLIKLLNDIDVQLKFIQGEQRVLLNGEDVSEGIRQPQISMAASEVSAVPEVRDYLFGLQKKLASENNVIMDGRDIGTVVLPNADVKIFLTASPEERADRRVKQLAEKGEHFSYDKILSEIIERDYNDTNRKAAPLKKADDAFLIDTTGLTKQESVEMVIKIITDRLVK